MLHTLTDEGQMGWRCVHCGAENTAPISEAELNGHPGAAQNRHTVRLPPCACGSQTYLKVYFTEEELRAPNMIDRNGNPTPSRAVAERHMQLAAQMEQMGKTPPGGAP
jgi:hypothetical protein